MRKKSFFLGIGSFFILLTFLHCTKKIEGEENAVDLADLVFTDSFSPVSYEYPLSRKIVKMVDTDIGGIIDPETTNPLWRSIYNTVNDFFLSLSKGEKSALHFTESSFNSFRLRYGTPSISSRYSLRVSSPEDDSAEKFWIQFKIIVHGKKQIGRLELIKQESSFFINDFEYQGLDALFLDSEK